MRDAASKHKQKRKETQNPRGCSRMAGKRVCGGELVSPPPNNNEPRSWINSASSSATVLRVYVDSEGRFAEQVSTRDTKTPLAEVAANICHFRSPRRSELQATSTIFGRTWIYGSNRIDRAC